MRRLIACSNAVLLGMILGMIFLAIVHAPFAHDWNWNELTSAMPAPHGNTARTTCVRLMDATGLDSVVRVVHPTVTRELAPAIGVQPK